MARCANRSDRERKRSHDKVYPKGYVEMLESQQGQLVTGLQELYRRLVEGRRWEGPALSESSGHPLTHDILAALNLLEPSHEESSDAGMFEEDCQKLQSRLWADGAGYARSGGSLSSESDLSPQTPTKISARSTPTTAKGPIFQNNMALNLSPSPLAQSPTSIQRQTYPSTQQAPQNNFSVTSEPQFSLPQWSRPVAGDQMFAMSPQPTMTDFDSMLGVNSWDPTTAWGMDMNHFADPPQQNYNSFRMQDCMLDPTDPDYDYQNFTRVSI